MTVDSSFLYVCCGQVAVTQSFFPEICKQMLADSQTRQSREVGGGIADLVSSRMLNLSPSQKKEDLHVEGFTVDEATAVATREAGSVQGVFTEKVWDLLIPSFCCL